MITFWKNNFKKSQISFKYVKNIRRILNRFHESNIYEGRDDDGAYIYMQVQVDILCTYTYIYKWNSKFTRNIFLQLWRI